MPEFEATFTVGADPVTTFDYIADWVNVGEWDPNVRSAKTLGEGEPEVGATYAVTTGFYGKAIETICEIETLDTPTRVVVGIDGGRLSGHCEILIFAIDPAPSGRTQAGCEVTYRIELELTGAARMLNRGLQLALSGMGENAVDGLRKRLVKQPA